MLKPLNKYNKVYHKIKQIMSKKVKNKQNWKVIMRQV